MVAFYVEGLNIYVLLSTVRYSTQESCWMRFQETAETEGSDARFPMVRCGVFGIHNSLHCQLPS